MLARMKPVLNWIGLCLLLGLPAPLRAEFIETDVCVFGASSGGIAAAIQATRMGKSVVIAEPGHFIGGLTTGGLGATDIGNKAAIGGIAREFYRRIARHYAQDSAWTFETRAEYFAKRGSGQSKASDLTSADATMWTFEPHVAEEIFNEMLKEAKVPVYFEQRLEFVRKEHGRITEMVVENANVYRAKMFIDATYEGDLLAKSDVSFVVGRESNREYDETLNGIRAETPKHQFLVPVDPYVKPGETNSGLLPFIQGREASASSSSEGDKSIDDDDDDTEKPVTKTKKEDSYRQTGRVGGKPGEGDTRVQTYNYRLCFTTNAANRMSLEAPRHYEAGKYELLARYFEALVAAGRQPKLIEFWNPIWLPNQKTDINNNGGFSTDFIGGSWDYPEADYKTRERIAKEHEDYTRGFLTFLATSPRVPENIREEMKLWGPCKDEFQTTDGWPNQIYVREARRMISDYVMTESHCRGKQRAEDSISLAAYNMDSHNVQRIVKNGRVENEGDVQVAPMSPYPISYRAIVPKRSECENLLVPVCLSASHIAYGSIRMEPVFMILGQSAATAACLAIDEKIRVQKVDYAKLRARLLADKQILEWPAASGARPTTSRTNAPAAKEP
jgi:FAD dependent oxidoreductase